MIFNPSPTINFVANCHVLLALASATQALSIVAPHLAHSCQASPFPRIVNYYFRSPMASVSYGFPLPTSNCQLSLNLRSKDATPHYDS
jgi:hypothetical protein